MAEVKNLYLALVFADAIVDEIWTVHQFADLSSLSNQATDARKTDE
jgi:hypothetical protein